MRVTAEEIKKEAKALAPEILRDRRRLHQCPEVGTGLPATFAHIRQRLEEMGIPWQDCGGELPEKMTEDYLTAGFPRMERATGLTALIGRGEPCILLRADMDALPIRGENHPPFPGDVLTCAATTAMPPCCWVRPGS